VDKRYPWSVFRGTKSARIGIARVAPLRHRDEYFLISDGASAGVRARARARCLEVRRVRSLRAVPLARSLIDHDLLSECPEFRVEKRS